MLLPIGFKFAVLKSSAPPPGQTTNLLKRESEISKILLLKEKPSFISVEVIKLKIVNMKRKICRATDDPMQS
jgi:hypothetical protein